MTPSDVTNKYPSYMTDKPGPLPYCPGCGHNVLVKSLDKALVKLQLDPAKVVLVTDIGCIGLTCKFFVTNAFHGLHGRSITYACGLKLARPCPRYRVTSPLEAKFCVACRALTALVTDESAS